MIQRQYNRATKLSVCHVEFLSTFIWADNSKRCPLCVWEAISDVAGQVCLNDQATKLDSLLQEACITLRFHHHEIWKVLCRTDESPLSVVNVGIGWDHLVPRYSVRWLRCALALIRRFCWVAWVKITLFSSSRKTSIRSSPQRMPSLIEKLRGNMKRFKLEVLHVKRNRDIKMARSSESDPPSLSKRPS